MFESESLNVDQVASLLGLSRNTVYKLAREGALPSYRIGRKLRFSRVELEALRSAEAQAASTHRATLSDSEPTSLKLQDAARTLAAQGRVLTLASDDPVAGTIASQLTNAGHPTQVRPMTSYTALVQLYSGLADMALINLYDLRSNSYNVPYVQRMAPGMPLVEFRLIKRKIGFLVPAGNPRHLNTWGALLREDVRIAQRPIGSGARVLMDQKLLGMEASYAETEGRALAPAAATLCAARVAAGSADVCIGNAEEAALVAGVGFVPLQNENLDLVVRKGTDMRQVQRLLRTMLPDARFQAVLASPMRDASTAGSIAYQC